MEIQEELLHLFNLWYGTRYRPRNVNCEEVELPHHVLTSQWIGLWFAKGERQKEVDVEFKQFESAVQKFKEFVPGFWVEKMAMIVLYDQITRNIFRKTSQAYHYDPISRKIALSILDENFDKIAVQFKITVLICLLHTEDLNIQQRVRENCQKLLDNPLYQNYGGILTQLKAIAGNHYDRILNFGRIPERNKYVGRVSSPDELVYLKAVN